MGSRQVRLSFGLRARATLAWGLIALVLSAALATFGYALTRDQLISERRNNAVTGAYLNARLVGNALRVPDPDISALLSSLEGNAGSLVLARVGGEWYSGSVGIGPDRLPRSLADAVSSGLAGSQLREIGDKPYVAIGVPIPAVDARYFELVPLDDIERTLDSLLRGLIVGALIATLAGATAGSYASARVLRPLRDVSVAAEKIAAGSLDTRIDAIADRDLQALESAFNRMVEAVQNRIDREVKFTSDVNHELRAPVAAMFSTLSVARRHQDDPKAAARAIEDLEGRVRDLYKLVEDLLEISRAEAGVAELQTEAVDPVGLTTALLERLGHSDLPLHVAEGVPDVIWADKRRVGQILQNLLDNAERYAGGATRIEITAGKGTVRFAVDDHGPGVPEHQRSFIFERFARGDAAMGRTTTGTGLGLALAAEHAALHGGRVDVQDRPGGGARFIIELPIEAKS